MSILDSLFTSTLGQFVQSNTLRRLRSATPSDLGRLNIEGQDVIDFSSNDYLGLSSNRELITRVQNYAALYGVGARASRLVTGNLTLHEQIESKIARFKGTQAALLFSSGWQLNASVLPAIFRAVGEKQPPLVFTDKLIHASLHHGCQAAGVHQIRFRHNDLNHLESLLQKASCSPGVRFILTESIFSMDGDRADVVGLTQLAERYNAFLYLDEAHATGVLGANGAGLSSTGNGRVDLCMGTFSKAMGSFGAYVAGSKALCDFLLNACSGFIYTTALPPSVLASIEASLDIVPHMNAERLKLQEVSNKLRSACQDLNISTGDSSTQIVPAIVGSEVQALQLSQALLDKGFLVMPIRPPTVPSGTSRLRITLSAAHSLEDIDLLINAIGEVQNKYR